MNIKISMPIYLVLALVITLTACTNIIRSTEESDQVRLYFLKDTVASNALKEFERECSLVGEVIGSEGHWYTYLFISNTHLTQGALNDLRNKARAMGADTVVVYRQPSFTTSVTFLGQGYRCSNGRAGKSSKSRF